MCGICGYLKTSEAKVQSQNLDAMTDTMRCRGPDDRGIFVERYSNLEVGLGQRRLSILDISSAGHQPMLDTEGSYCVVYNGEVYNFLELRKELEQLGYDFHSRSDTEVILAAYTQWGKGCFNRFNGMFSLAIWDKKRQELTLARDRAGIKPLYYYSVDGHFVFGSELKALLQYPYFRRELDDESLCLYFLFGYVPEPKAIFKNTYKLEPGTLLTVSKRGLEHQNYWKYDGEHLSESAIMNGSEENVIIELEKLLQSSVEYRMISDVPIGAFLSGGIDSSLIVAMMQKAASVPVKTFSIGFEEKKFDEAPFARRIAKHLGTDHHELYVTGLDVLGVVEKLCDIYDEPFADSSSIPTYLVSEFTRRQVTVSLSGDGGDELFCGYIHYHKLNLAKNFEYLPSLLRKKLFALIEKIPLKRLRVISRGLQYDNLADYYQHLVGTMSVRSVGQILVGMNGDVPFHNSTFYNRFFSCSSNNPIEKAMDVDFHTCLVGDILTKVDRASMAVSLEARVPFLDHRIIEFAAKLPLKYKYQNGVQKRILKKILAKYVPPSLFERPKAGFAVPLGKWFRTELKDLLVHCVQGTRQTMPELFSMPQIEKIKDLHLSGKSDFSKLLWLIVSFYLWYERYVLKEDLE